MIINILDTGFQMLDIIDDAQSIIWTKRFQDCGDFELHMIINEKNLKKVQNGYYLTRDDDDTVMIIENIRITTNVETGNFLTVTGRSMESLFDRRCVTEVTRGWGWTAGIGSPINTVFIMVQDQIDWIGEDYRRLPIDLINRYSETLAPFRVQTDGMRWCTEFIYGTLLDVLRDECRAVGVGFKLSMWAQKTNFIDFDAIVPTDRSINQTENPQVIFSREYDNLISSNYAYVTDNYRSCAVVFGEGEGVDRVISIVRLNNASGLDLYEIPIDARDLSSKVEDGKTLTPAEYKELLNTRGLNKLREHGITESFEGEIQEGIQWHYKQDYFIGDIVTIQNEYGIQKDVIIAAVTECEDDTGYYCIPVFENVEVRI